MRFTAVAVCSGLALLGLGRAGLARNVDFDRLNNADREPGQWMSYGRNYNEQRFSPLRQITTDNVEPAGPRLERRSIPSAARRPRRWWSTA